VAMRQRSMAYYAETFGGLAGWVELNREELGTRIFDAGHDRVS